MERHALTNSFPSEVNGSNGRVDDVNSITTIEPRSAVLNGIAEPSHTPPANGGAGIVASHAPTSADIHPGVGFRIRRDFPRLPYDAVSMFEGFEVPDISDQLNRLYAIACYIKCVSGDDRRLAGPACTVKVYPGDNLMVHKALDIAKPGDIIVVDAGGSSQNAVLGDTISMKARHRGVRGFVIDGYVRDLSAIRAMNYPVYARGDMPKGPLHRGPGEVNYPICCGGVVVMPGDLVIADRDGIVILPQASIAALHQRLRQHKDSVASYLDNVRKGHFSNAWVDKLLDAGKCPIED